MAREEDKIILGSWLIGEHLEDVKTIPVAAFGDLAPVAKQIRLGETSYVKIAKAAGIHISEISDILSHAQYENVYESIMAEHHKRELQSWLQEHPNAEPEEILETIQKHTRTYTRSLPNGVTMSDAILRYYEELDRRKNRDMVYTGIRELDDSMNGIMPGTLTAVGARPSTGKSAFMLQIAVNVAAAGAKVMFFPLEMSVEDTTERIIMRYTSGLRQREIKTGQLEPDQWDRIYGTASDLEDIQDNLMVFENVRDIETIEALTRKHAPNVVFIDQLQQLEAAEQFQSVRERFGHMTKNLKRISMESQTSVWLACQLNRNARGTDATMADLKEAGNIEEDSDNVILLSRDEDAEEDRVDLNGARVIKVDLAKQRSGMTGDFLMKFVPYRFTFQTLPEMPPPGFSQVQEEIPW